MNLFTKFWFWLLILSIIGFIIFFIGFEVSVHSNPNNVTTPAWIWVVFGISVFLFIVAAILYYISASCCVSLELVTDCGDPAPKIEYPKKCPEKKVIECQKPRVVKKPCVKEVTECVKKQIVTEQDVVVYTDEPSNPRIIETYEEIIPTTQIITTQQIIPTTQTYVTRSNITPIVSISNQPEEAFAAANTGLKPLSSLAPS